MKSIPFEEAIVTELFANISFNGVRGTMAPSKNMIYIHLAKRVSTSSGVIKKKTRILTRVSVLNFALMQIGIWITLHGSKIIITNLNESVLFSDT